MRDQQNTTIKGFFCIKTSTLMPEQKHCSLLSIITPSRSGLTVGDCLTHWSAHGPFTHSLKNITKTKPKSSNQAHSGMAKRIISSFILSMWQSHQFHKISKHTETTLICIDMQRLLIKVQFWEYHEQKMTENESKITQALDLNSCEQHVINVQTQFKKSSTESLASYLNLTTDFIKGI